MTSVAFNMSKVHDIMLNKNCKMKLKHVSVLKVKKVLKSLSNSRSTGIDELDNFSVKLAAEFYCPTSTSHHNPINHAD